MTLDLNYSIVADHLQAQTLVCLLLELFLFIKNKKLSLSSEIIISICIFSSIFSVFSSIVSIGILALIILIIEGNEFFKKRKIDVLKFLNYLLKKYYRFIIIVMIPFLIIGIYYLINGSLGQFYRQAFYFNTNIYSNYTFNYNKKS